MLHNIFISWKAKYSFLDGPGPGNPDIRNIVENPRYTIKDYIIDSSWLAITIFVLLAIVFASTTFYYWRKSRRMAKNLLQEHDDPNNEDGLKDDGKRKRNFNVI